MQPNLIIVEEVESFARVAAEWVAGSIRENVSTRGRCSVALAGGETPRAVYELLSTSDLNRRIEWEHLDFYFGDERCVPPEHIDSNYRMAYESLFSPAPVRPGQINRIEGERTDRDRAAADYEARLPEKLDLILLGMGVDGHTVSLFPRSPALDEEDRRVLPVRGSKPPSWRITITPPVIAAARNLLVMIAGKGKASAAVDALRGPYNPKEIPIQLALRGTWILDASVAKELVRSQH
jgi:6-phosphogluconolactonase